MKKPATTVKKNIKRQVEALKKMRKPEKPATPKSFLSGTKANKAYVARAKKIMGAAGYKWSKGSWVRKKAK